jgi:hypothetical protein
VPRTPKYVYCVGISMEEYFAIRVRGLKVFMRVYKIAKNDISFVMSVRVSAWNISAPTRTDLHEI